MTGTASEPFRYTLVPDGGSDRALVPILDRLLSRYSTRPWISQVAHGIGHGALGDRIPLALLLYPCDVLFVHRDAEKQKPAKRCEEVDGAAGGSGVPYVPVVPVRMLEAWLLVDADAVRAASGNRHGKGELVLPSAKHLEAVPDPKKMLFGLLQSASGLSGRRLQGFRVEEARTKVAGHISDYSVLEALPAYRRLEAAVRDVLPALGAATTYDG